MSQVPTIKFLLVKVKLKFLICDVSKMSFNSIILTIASLNSQGDTKQHKCVINLKLNCHLWCVYKNLECMQCWPRLV